MPTNKVVTNRVYIYHANMLDRVDGRTSLKDGDKVRVVRMHGCPPPNTMGHAHVADPMTGEFIGLVHCNSLHTVEEYMTYLRVQIAKHEAAATVAKYA